MQSVSLDRNKSRTRVFSFAHPWQCRCPWPLSHERKPTDQLPFPVHLLQRQGLRLGGGVCEHPGDQFGPARSGWLRQTSRRWDAPAAPGPRGTAGERLVEDHFCHPRGWIWLNILLNMSKQGGFSNNNASNHSSELEMVWIYFTFSQHGLWGLDASALGQGCFPLFEVGFLPVLEHPKWCFEVLQKYLEDENLFFSIQLQGWSQTWFYLKFCRDWAQGDLISFGSSALAWCPAPSPLGIDCDQHHRAAGWDQNQSHPELTDAIFRHTHVAKVLFSTTHLYSLYFGGFYHGVLTSHMAELVAWGNAVDGLDQDAAPGFLG